MSKVAINGQKIPLVPLAGIVAGLLAAIGFFMLPQSVLEAFVYQLRLDTMLPAARPPLGFTARLLAAVGAGLATGVFTALLAWKFARPGGKPVVKEEATPSADAEPTGRSRRFGREPEPVVEPMSVEAAAAPFVAPAVEADAIIKEKPAKKSRFRLGRKAKEEEIDVDAMPMTRNRGLTGAVQRESVFDHDDQSAGNALDISSATDAMQDRFVDLPEWAYEENCDLSGVRSGITAPADPNASISDAVPVVDENDDPFALDSFKPEPFTPAPFEPAVDEAVAPTSDDEPLTLDQTADGQIVDWAGEDADFARPASAGAADWGVADWSEETDQDDAHAEVEAVEAEVEVAAEDAGSPLSPAPTEDATIPAYAAASAMPRPSTEDASIEELLERAEAGLRRRAEMRAAMVAAQPAVPASTTVAPEADAAPAPASNPFAGFEHKEAEVDEALRAALSTLERMNRRSA